MENNNKKLEIAVNNIAKAIRQYKGTYEEHVRLQEDLKLLIDYINNKHSTLIKNNEEIKSENE